MGTNSRVDRQAVSDAEIDRDVAELRQLLANVQGPAEPHPAYWQNFVVRVRDRIDHEGGRRKRWNLVPAWASLGAAAVVTIIVVSISGDDQPIKMKPGPQPPAAMEFSASYSATDTRSLVLSEQDVRMINAIVSDDRDDAIFEALVEEGQ